MNAFSKEERVAFETLLEGFNDALVMSKLVSVYNTDQAMMERANDIIHRPMPYIANSIDFTPGVSIAGSYQSMTQLTVPATIGFCKTVPWTMTSKELRDSLQEGRIGEAARQRLASDINQAVLNTATAYGSLVVPIAAAPGTYDDVALFDTIMTEQGVPDYDRVLALATRDYHGFAGDLAGPNRSFGNRKSDNAYERSYVGDVAKFKTFALDYTNRINAAAGGTTTIDTRTSANNYYVPRSTSTSIGGKINVDNRFQTITVSNTVGVAVGDAFTIDGVEAVHHITKGGTGQLKTFRVVSITNGTQMVITPAIVSNQGNSDVEKQYQNVIVTPSATASITWLNVNKTNINVFWQKSAIELLPGRLAVPTNAGVAVMQSSTDQGIQVVMQKSFDMDSGVLKYKLDTLFGTVALNTEMIGIGLFNQ